MAKLPVYTNNANVNVAGIVKPESNPIWGAVNKAASVGQELAVQWQKTQNAAESLDGKNKMIADTMDILTEAENFTDYKTPADLKRKEDELIGKMNNVLPSVTGGFTNGRNAQQFSRENQITMAQNTEKLKAIFRNKYIDNNAANLAISYENNMKRFVETGSESFKQSYKADLESSFAAGYISEKEKTNLSLKLDDWDKYMVLRQAETDPEGVIANLEAGNYKIKPEDMNDLLKDLNSVKTNKKLMDNYKETVKQDQGESDTTDFIYGDASYDEKLQFINDKEFTGDISGAFAQKARRAIKRFKPEAEKRISNAQSMADVLQRVYDLNDSAENSTEYLNGIRSIREAVVDMHSLGDITTKDVVALNNQINTATRARISEATTDVGYKFSDAKKYFKSALPPELQNEAIRDMFYATQSLDMEGKSEKDIKRIYHQKAVDVAEKIIKENRLNVEQAYQEAVSNTDGQFIKSLAEKKGVSFEAMDKDIDFTAQKYGLTREQVINKLRGKM